jgi:hypothetical protein
MNKTRTQRTQPYTKMFNSSFLCTKVISLRVIICDITIIIICDNNDNNSGGVTLSGAIYTSKANKRNDINNNDKKAINIQNESLDKYRSLSQSLVVLALPG